MKKQSVRLLNIVGLALLSLAQSHAAALYPVLVSDRWGFIDKSGNIVTNPQFDEALPFSDGLARVKVGRKIGYVDPTGEYAWNPAN